MTTVVRKRVAAAIVVAALLGARRADSGGSPGEDDAVPSAMVAFFDGDACPAGWIPSEQTAGRLVVGVNLPNHVGVQVGQPLADREDRTHAHAVSGTVTLPPRNIAAADGPNGSGAASGDHTFTAVTDGATSGLPFVQLVVCEHP